MALTWRNVDAPQISTRDLAQAGHSITNAFDRLGSTLSQREATLRQRATDSAIAQRLAIQDPEALGTMDLTGLDPRANLREVVTADNTHRSELIRRADQNEDLLNKRALASFGQEHYDLAVAAFNGDEAAIAQVRQLNEANPMFGRYMAQVTDDLMGYRDTGVGRRETQRSNEATEAISQQNANTNAGHLGLARDRFTAEQQQLEKAEQRRIGRIADDQFGRTFVDEMVENADPTMSTDDTLRWLRRTEAFKGLTPERQTAVRKYMTDDFYGRDARLTPTEMEREELAGYENLVAQNAAALESAMSADLSNYDATRRPSQAIAGAAEFKDVTPEEVYSYAKTRDIPEEDVDRIMQANPNITYPVMMSMLRSDGTIKDSSLFSQRTGRSMGPSPLGFFFSDYFHGGERLLERRAEEVQKRLGQSGDAIAYQHGREAVTANHQMLMTDLTRARRRLLAARAAGRPTAEHQEEIRRISARIERATEGSGD